MSMEIFVPVGCAGGSVVEFTDSTGTVRSAVVPEGLVEGDIFHVQLPPAREPPEWLDAILDAITADNFVAILTRWLDDNCSAFLTPGIEGHTLEQTEVHQKYCRLYESRIESYLKRHKISSDEFLAALLAAEEECDDKHEQRLSLSACLLLVNDFEAFAKMCKQRALEAG
jgi:hypothetical protein